MNEDLKRKEVWIDQSVIDRLQSSADKKGWSLKQYMEWILKRASMKGIQKSPEVR